MYLHEMEVHVNVHCGTSMEEMESSGSAEMNNI